MDWSYEELKLNVWRNEREDVSELLEHCIAPVGEMFFSMFNCHIMSVRMNWNETCFARSVLLPELKKLIRYGKRLVKFQSFSDYSELFLAASRSNLNFVPLQVHWTGTHCFHSRWIKLELKCCHYKRKDKKKASLYENPYKVYARIPSD